MKKFVFLFVGILLFFVNSASTFALPEIKGESQITITNDIEDDAYFAGGMVVIDGNVNGDLFVTGASITVNGNIKGDLMVMGGNIVIKGTVGEDARIVGGNITMIGSIGDDLFIGGGTVYINPSVVIGGSLYGGIGILNFQGAVKENMVCGGGNVTFGGQVQGNVDMQTSENITILPAAKVQGDFKYTSPQENTFDKTFIQGKYEYVKQDIVMVRQTQMMFFGLGMFLLFSFLSSFVLGLIMIFLVPYTLHNVSEKMFTAPWRSLGYGFMTFIAICVLAIVSFALVITWKLGLLFMMLIGAYFLFVGVFNAYFLAYWMMKRQKMSAGKTLLYFTGALVVYEIICFIPVIGWLFAVVISLISLGGFVAAKKELYGKMRTENLL